MATGLERGRERDPPVRGGAQELVVCGYRGRGSGERKSVFVDRDSQGKRRGAVRVSGGVVQETTGGADRR